MELHQIQKPVLPNGTIVIDEVPFEAGEMINITLEKAKKIDPDNPYPLRGTPYSYEDPFGPAVPLEEWDALK